MTDIFSASRNFRDAKAHLLAIENEFRKANSDQAARAVEKAMEQFDAARLALREATRAPLPADLLVNVASDRGAETMAELVPRPQQSRGASAMGKIDDPKVTKPIVREPEPAGTPIERKDPPDADEPKAPTVPEPEVPEAHALRGAPGPAKDAERDDVPPGTPLPQGDPFHDDEGRPVPIPDMDIPSTES